MAQALGERVGVTVGYSVRGDSVTSGDTRIEVVTAGVLVRRLQRDPGLARVGAVLVDEFHERGLDSDLALALAANAQQLLRPDLRLVVMSATLGDGLAERTSDVLGGAGVVRSLGRCFPVDVIHLPEPPPGELERSMAAAVKRALQEQPGDALVFLPGAPEIRRTQAILRDSLSSQARVTARVSF
jgi:ATP-dependent helicase HrpB